MKYILCPGPVRSEKYGVTHHVTAKELAKLYKVQFSACSVLPRDHDLKGWKAPVDGIFLYPRADGKYNLESNT